MNEAVELAIIGAGPAGGSRLPHPCAPDPGAGYAARP